MKRRGNMKRIKIDDAIYQYNFSFPLKGEVTNKITIYSTGILFITYDGEDKRHVVNVEDVAWPKDWQWNRWFGKHGTSAFGPREAAYIIRNYT
jgi:hypothetical protein